MADRIRGNSVPVSAGRRLVNDFLRQSRHVPLVTLRRDFYVPALVAARGEARLKHSWIVLFAKAFGLAAKRHVHLRRNWLTFPWARIYEHPNSECVVLVERDWHGEEIVLGAKVRAPEDTPLSEIDGHIRRFRGEPVLSISPFRQMLRIARYPAILRRFVFWSSLNWSGNKRCKRFGTFLVSSLGNYGSELLAPHVPLTSYLTFGPITADGHVAVALAFDHRVMDGRHAARALEDIERIMNTTVLMELRLAQSEADSVEEPARESLNVESPIPA
jgi:hypothetical protein